MHFEDAAEAKKRRERERAARKASKSDIVMALREEFDETPMEESHHVKSLADDAEMKHRIRFEEDNFMRLNVTKADKKRFREKMRDSSLSAYDEFKDLEGMTDADDRAPEAQVLQKRSLGKDLFRGGEGRQGGGGRGRGGGSGGGRGRGSRQRRGAHAPTANRKSGGFQKGKVHRGGL